MSPRPGAAEWRFHNGNAPFVTLEGGEGAGKSSALPALEAVLRRAGFDVVVTREPGGTPANAAIRALIVQRADHDWNPLSELLLLMADRAEHVDRLIRPALEAGAAVLCDRFEASSYAYQGAGKGLGAQLVGHLQEIVSQGAAPDLTVLLDVDPAVGLARSARRLAKSGSSEGRFEALDPAFHQRVRSSFLEQSQSAPDRWIVVDANQPLQSMLVQAAGELERRLARLGLPAPAPG